MAITSSTFKLTTMNRPYFKYLFTGAAVIAGGEIAGLPKQGLGGNKTSTETTGYGFAYVTAGWAQGTMNFGEVKGFDLGVDILTGFCWSPLE